MDSSKNNGLEDLLAKQQLQYIKNCVLKHLFKFDPSWPFRKPVDTVTLKLHDYFDIIKHPMDMGTIKKKLNQKKYSNAQACIDDFRLMFKNCYTYNRPTDDVITYCKSVENYFNQLIKRMPMEVKSAKRGRGRVPAAAAASASPKQVRKSNGSISASLSLNLPPSVKNETKPKAASNNSLVPTVMPPKNSASVNNNRLDVKSSLATSAAAATPAAVALTNTLDIRSAAAALETHSSAIEHTVASSSKIKKLLKRKTEGEELPETKKPLRLKPEEDELVEVKKSLKRKAEDKDIFDVRKSSKRKLHDDESRSSLEPSVSGQMQLVIEQRPAKQPKKEVTKEEMPDLTNGRKLSSNALTYCYNVLLNMIEDQPDEPDASQLYRCVDPNEPGMENYYKIVKRPMDLFTVKKNLETGVYTEIKQFAADMRQVFSNCYRYNVNNTKLIKTARDLQNFFEVRYARAPEENEPPPSDSPKHDETFSQAKRTMSTSSSSSDDATCKKTDHDDKIELLQQQLLKAQERINSLQSNSQPLKKEKKPKPKPKVTVDFPDVEPSPVTLSISKPPPPQVEEEEVPAAAAAAAAAAAEPLPKPVKPTKAKTLSHKKTAQKPVTTVAMAAADIPDPLPPPQAAALEPDYKQELKRLAALLPQLPVSEKKSEHKKHSEASVEAVVEEDVKKKTGTLDSSPASPVHPAGHLLPQQPMRPCNTAAPKPASKVLSGTSSSFGSQVRHPAPEPISAPLPQPVALKPIAATQQDHTSSPLTDLHESISAKPTVLPEKKPTFSIGGPVGKTDEQMPTSARPAPMPATAAAARPVPNASKQSSSPTASVAKKLTTMAMGNSTEDSSSPKIFSKPGSSLDLASTPVSAKTPLLSAKSVPATVGPFGVDTLKPTTPKEAVLKPSTSSWSLLNLKANSKAPVPKAVPQKNVNASFNHYKELAKQRNASEKLQEKEKERQKMESEERERKKREEQKAKEEEEALMRALNNSERVQAQAPAPESKPKETPAEKQAKLKEQERLREQQRRRMEAQSNKIDMNFQSDLLASFEHTLKNPS